MAQAAHAATAVLEQYRNTSEVKAYLNDLGNMRKVVMEVSSIHAWRVPVTTNSQASGERELSALAEKLDALEPRIPYYLWVEQPYVSIPTSTSLSTAFTVSAVPANRKGKHAHRNSSRSQPSSKSPQKDILRAGHRSVEVDSTSVYVL
jgi:hypothetical protein